MLPPRAALKHPFRIYDFDVRVSGGSLDFGCLAIGIGDDVRRSAVNASGNLCTKTGYP